MVDFADITHKMMFLGIKKKFFSNKIEHLMIKRLRTSFLVSGVAPTKEWATPSANLQNNCRTPLKVKCENNKYHFCNINLNIN